MLNERDEKDFVPCKSEQKNSDFSIETILAHSIEASYATVVHRKSMHVSMAVALS